MKNVKRLIIVYSPRSARFEEVQKKVIEKARKLPGWIICKFEVEEVPVQENATKLAKILRKDDLVLSAGGDGTASMCLNAILKSNTLATLSVMPFGNFNDYAETLGRMSLAKIIRKFEEGRWTSFYPMEIKVNERHYIYSGMYFTIGLMAEAERIFKKPKIRAKLTKARSRMSFSARKLFSWYLKNKRRKDFLPTYLKINNKNVVKNTTDYVAMNGKSMAGVVPGKGWFTRSDIFWSGTMRNRSFWRMLAKFIKATEGELPGKETSYDVLEFTKPCSIFVHAEGEGEELKNISKIEVKKPTKSLRIITE